MSVTTGYAWGKMVHVGDYFPPGMQGKTQRWEVRIRKHFLNVTDV